MKGGDAMNINKIKNETLRKLTAREIGDLDLCNHGVGLYRGELKSRKKGVKAVKVSDYEFHFVGTVSRIEFVKIVSEGETQEWAARIYRFPTHPGPEGEYETFPMGITGCDFFK